MAKGVLNKHLSVLELQLHSSVYKLLIIIAALAAVETGLMLWRGMPQPSFDLAVSESYLVLAFMAAYLCTLFVLISEGKKSMVAYTLKRLRISERAVFVWSFAAGVICLVLLWAAQTGVLFGLSKLWESGARDYAASAIVYGPQGMYLAFYRNNFLHALVPLQDLAKHISNVILILGLAAACSYIKVRNRMENKRVFAPIILVAMTPQFFMDSQPSLWVFSAVFAAFGIYCFIAGYTNSDNGRDHREAAQTSPELLQTAPGAGKEAGNA